MKLTFLSTAVLAAILLAAPVLDAVPPSSPGVVVVPYAGPIGPPSAEYITRGIGEAESRHAAAFVLELDTPGGLDSSMRQIIQREMNSTVPVIVFVGPSGARA